MIYLFAGEDAVKKQESFQKFIKSVGDGVETFVFNKNDFDMDQVENLYSGSGLFFAKSVVVFPNILDREETRDLLLEKLDKMSESENIFIFLEGKLGKGVLDSFRGAHAELNVFELPKEKKEKFDNFLLANAFSQKDKLNLWIYFRQAMNVGVGMEELIGVLFWKAKDMILKRNFSKFSEDELKNFASKLSYLLPEARSRGPNAEFAFEQFLLETF